MTRTLYLTRNGLLEPLGQSQVISYLRGLSTGYDITLITYEKAEDFADQDRVAAARADCEAHGITWKPQQFRARPKLIAPALSMIRMVWLLLSEVRGQDIKLLHARSYIPAAVALVVHRLTGVPFIFDMRALWPEELITAGRLRRGSLLHRLIAGAERAAIRRAGAVVSLTHAAAAHLEEVYPAEMAAQRVAVIPTCADLDRFKPASAPLGTRKIGCLGTVLSGWFRLDWLARFVDVALTCDAELTFEITTRDDPGKVRAALDPDGQFGDRLTIAPSPSELVQGVVQGQMSSVMFFTGGLSKLGSSPTRMAEILGCGLPVVANEGVGDVGEIIRKYDVGVLAKSGSQADMSAAYDALLRLLDDPGLAARCRACALEVFSLDAGTNAYRQLYDDVLNGEPACAV